MDKRKKKNRRDEEREENNSCMAVLVILPYASIDPSFHLKGNTILHKVPVVFCKYIEVP